MFVSFLKKVKIFFQTNDLIDIFFVMFFFILLCLPMSHISHAEKSEQENRMLAKYQPLFQNGEINLHFGTNFEEWYNDRFFGKNFVLTFYHSLLSTIVPFSGNNQVLVGKDGWLFYRQDNGIENFANITELSETNIKLGLKYLQDIDNWCQRHNKKFYYVIVPDKNKIYGEYFATVKKVRSDDYGIGYQFANYIRKNSNIKVLYLRDFLMAHKKDGLLYCKEGTHWSELGAYWAWQEISKLLLHDFDLHKITVDDFNYNGLASLDLVRLLDRKPDTDTLYIHPNYKRHATCKSKDAFGRVGEGLVTCANANNKYNAFVFRDSFYSWLIPYTADTFHKTKVLWTYNIDESNLDDIHNNYDVVILETVERLIPRLSSHQFPQNIKD